MDYNEIPLRNITFVSVVQGESDLDLLLTEEEQKRFISGLSTKDSSSRVSDTDLRRRYQAKFLRLQKQDVYLDFLDVVKIYARQCLPSPKKTELSFWSVSCLPSGSQEPKILSRVNLNMQEVLTAFCDISGLAFTFHVARSPLEQAFGAIWRETLEASGAKVLEHRYAPGGQDQIAVCCDKRQALRLLEVPAFLNSARCLNLRLMRKGPTKYNRYHSANNYRRHSLEFFPCNILFKRRNIWYKNRRYYSCKKNDSG